MFLGISTLVILVSFATLLAYLSKEGKEERGKREKKLSFIVAKGVATQLSSVIPSYIIISSSP